MQVIQTTLPFIEIGLSVLLVILILLQRSQAGLGSAFGGDSFAVGNYARRGSEKGMFYLTIVVAILFVASVITDAVFL